MTASAGGPSAVAVASLINEHSTAGDRGDNRRFVQALIFNWLVCGTDAHARNYSLMLRGPEVALAPLYDVNSHLAYSDGTGNDLSMSVGDTYRAAAVTAEHWTRVAQDLFVEPEWVREEVHRQIAEVRDALADVTKGDDVVGYQSPVLARLITQTHRWVEMRASQPTGG